MTIEYSNQDLVEKSITHVKSLIAIFGEKFAPISYYFLEHEVKIYKCLIGALFSDKEAKQMEEDCEKK